MVGTKSTGTISQDAVVGVFLARAKCVVESEIDLNLPGVVIVGREGIRNDQ